MPRSSSRAHLTVAADEFVVLSGQHTFLAMQRRANDYRSEMLAVPRKLEFVSNTILAPGTPLNIREFASGDAQAVQSAVQAVTIPEFAALLHREKERGVGLSVHPSAHLRAQIIL